MAGKVAPAKTNAMRALDKHGICYVPYTYDPSITTAEGVAERLHVSPSEVFKTLVMLGDHDQPLLVMVAGDQEVNLRIFAREAGHKSARMASKKDAERMTGLQTGGISALALLQKNFAVYVSREALRHESIYVNGGRRGLNLLMRTEDLIGLTGAHAVRVQ